MLVRILLHALLWPVLLVTIAWGCAVLWIDGPSSRPIAGALAGVFVLAALVVLIRFRPLRRGVAAYGVLFLVLLGWWLSIPPSNDRDWQRDVAELASASIDGTTSRSATFVASRIAPAKTIRNDGRRAPTISRVSSRWTSTSSSGDHPG